MCANHLFLPFDDSRQVQILHERDSCCFSPQGRHDQMLGYESNIRNELVASAAASGSAKKHGWFTSTADNHTKHEVCAQDKTIISASMKGDFAPGSDAWQKIPCDIIHQPVDQPGVCAPNVEPGAPGPEPKSESLEEALAVLQRKTLDNCNPVAWDFCCEVGQ